jgi:sorting nexin-29
MQNNRALGAHNLMIEFFKCGRRALKERVHKLIMQIWQQEQMPEEWNMGLILLIFKKGDKMECQNYRGIMPLSVVYKIFSTILVRKLSLYSDEILSEYQCGLCASRSTVKQIFVLRQSLEKCYKYGIDVHKLFIDYKQDFDSID